MKKKWQYEVIAEEMVTEEGESYVGYGIGVRVGSSRLTPYQRTVRDLSVDRKRVETLCRTCQRLRLDPIHLDEVAEDFLEMDGWEDL